MAAACEHDGARTLWNKEAGIVFRGDCGDRRGCVAARRRKNREMYERLALVEYFRAPDLWTFTARADCGEVNRENLADFNRGLERVVRAIARQAERERAPGYRRTRHAAALRRRYGTDRVARGRPGAALRIRVRESGELRGRLHAHAASDFDYLHKLWLQDACDRCGLGFCEFERRDTKALHSAARFSGAGVRAATVARYLSKYLSMPDDRPWPWPSHARLVSSGRRILPPRQTKPGYRITWRKVSTVAVDEFGAVAVDDDATFYRRRGPELAPATPWYRLLSDCYPPRPRPPRPENDELPIRDLAAYRGPPLRDLRGFFPLGK